MGGNLEETLSNQLYPENPQFVYDEDEAIAILTEQGILISDMGDYTISNKDYISLVVSDGIVSSMTYNSYLG